MPAGILGTAVSGLMAFQRSLETTGNNIANVNTEGYSRQRTELGTREPQFTGAGFVGSGVEVKNIVRSYDRFITNQLRASSSAFGDVNRYYQLAKEIDNTVADPSTGMAPAIKNFFNSVNEVADDPASIPARQVMLSEAEILTERFHTMNSRFTDLTEQVNQDLSIMVKDVNSLANSIADLNLNIMTAIGKATNGQQPNDLLDKRDAELVKLAELVDVSVLPVDDGTLSVFIGQGQPLVLGTKAATFSVRPNELDPARLEILMGTQEITKNLSGGKISGTMRFRDEVLNPAQQRLGQIAAGMAMEFNAVHVQGYDLKGVQGQDFFNFGTTEIPVSKSTATVGVISAQYQDINVNGAAAGNLDISDYQLDYDGVNYTLTRLADNTSFNLQLVANVPPTGAGTGTLVVPTPPVSPGDTLPGIAIAVTTALNNNDRFLIKPTSNAAKNIVVNIADKSKIAAATNVATDSSGATYIVNGPMPGDNRNALLLANLENKQSLLGGTATFQDGYGQLVAETGTLTHAAELSSTAQQTLLNQAKGTWESISGVNLDEEAANLIKFQQSYQAAAQLISVTSSLFDTLIGAVR
jgi:flagellar hook-associated protein 1